VCNSPLFDAGNLLWFVVGWECSEFVFGAEPFCRGDYQSPVVSALSVVSKGRGRLIIAPTGVFNSAQYKH